MGAFTYPRREPGSAGHMDLVERLHTAVSEVRAEFEGLPEDAVTYRPGEGEWSLKEVLGHLCDYAKHLHDRLYRMIKLEEPRLPAWDALVEMEGRNPQQALLQDLLYELATQTAETVDMLADLVHWNWARQGRHEEHGRLSIRRLVELAIAHEEHHLQHIRELKAAATAASRS